MINKINIDETHQLAITNFNTGKREEAERLFREVLKTNPSHFDANHYCYAYLYGLDTPSLGIHDDGEPKHSAGDPILGQIKSFNVSNALVVVVRYFGGTKLGVGGLSNAYRQAAAAALTQAVLVPYIEKKRFKVFYDYDQTKLLLSLFRDYEPEIIEKEYLQKCWMVVDVKKEQATAFKDRLHRNEFQLTEDVK